MIRTKLPASLRSALQKPIIEHAQRTPAMLHGHQVANGATALADLLAPDGIDQGRGYQPYVRVGDSCITTLAVTAYPPTLPLAWVGSAAEILQEPGIIVHQRIDPVPNIVASKMLAKSENAALGTLSGDMQIGQGLDADAQLGMHATAQLRVELAAGHDRLVQYATSISVAAPSPDEVAQRVEALKAGLSQGGYALHVPRLRQRDGYRSMLPVGRDDLGLTRDMSGRAAAQGLPTATPGLSHRGGLPIWWGKHPMTDTAIFCDTWQLTNPHAVVIAESGSGKSYLWGGLIAQQVALGQDAVLILDPKLQEYRGLVTALGGVYISLSQKAGYHINPLEPPRLTPERARAVEAQELDLLGQRIGVVKALIVGELKAQGTHVDAEQMVAVEDAIVAAYTANGISRDARTFHRPAPLFSDVQRELDQAGHALLARSMALFTRGTVGDLFNHPSNIPTENPLLALDLSALLQAQDEVLNRLIPVVVMDFFVSVAVNRPTGRRYHLVLDEAHAFLHTEAGAKALNLIYRIGRSLEFKATVITQSLRDLEGSSMTAVLLENSKTKHLLGLNEDSDAVSRVAALLGLNEHEAGYLASCKKIKGVGSWSLLFADGERTPLFTPMWPETLHRVVTGRSRSEG